MTFIVLANQRKAIENGKPVSPSVLRGFLEGALPHFWEECAGLAHMLIREKERPCLEISVFPEEAAWQVRFGMAMMAYRRAVEEFHGCRFMTLNASEVMAMKHGESLQETPCSARPPVVIREDQPAGYGAIQEMADALVKDPSLVVIRDMREMYLATRQDLVVICATDPYRRSLGAALNVHIAMQGGRIAMRRRGVASSEFDRFCSIEELIRTWPNPKSGWLV